MKFRKKKKDSLVSVDDLLKCLLQFKCPHRSPGQDVGICQGVRQAFSVQVWEQRDTRDEDRVLETLTSV